MKVRLFTVLALLAIVVAGISPRVAQAQAYSTAFTTAITYQNVGADTATVSVLFYSSADDLEPSEFPQPDLPQGAGTSLHIGSLSLGGDFQGSAVMQSNEPLLATLVQLPQGSATVRNRPLSNGFSAGTEDVLIATVLKNTFDTNTIFSVQNVGSAAAVVDIHFYNTSATEVFADNDVTIQPGAAYYVDAGQTAGLGAAFNGSALVDGPTGASLIGSAMELAIAGTAASAFEGVGQGATTFYMPSALCNYSGSNTAYAIQNTSLTESTDVTVTYQPGGATETKTILPGAKQSFIACQATGMPASNFLGSAIVESDTTPVVAIGKAYGTGLSTAFVGAAAGTGAAEIALPYVRWADAATWASGEQQRVNITIQNIGAADLPANAISVEYISMTGTLLGTHTIATTVAIGAKANSNASSAGLTSFGFDPATGKFGGGAIVRCSAANCQLAVVARVSTQVSAGFFASEDYNGMPIP